MANLVRNIFKHPREYLRSSYRLMQSDATKNKTDLSTQKDDPDLPMREKLTGEELRKDTAAAPVVINLFEDTAKIKQSEKPEPLKYKPQVIRRDPEELSNKVEYQSKESQMEKLNDRLERLLIDIKTSLENVENQLKRSLQSPSQLARLKKLAMDAERDERMRRRLEIVVSGMNNLSDDDDPTIRASEFIEMYFKLRDCVWSARLFGNEKQFMVITFRNMDVKNHVMKNTSLLKGVGIYIMPHFTLEQRIRYQRLRKVGLDAQRLGKTVRIGYTYVIIDGEKYVWNDRTSSLELKQY